MTGSLVPILLWVQSSRLKYRPEIHYLCENAQGQVAKLLWRAAFQNNKKGALNNSDVIEEKLEDSLGKYQSNLNLVCIEDILGNGEGTAIILQTFCFHCIV